MKQVDVLVNREKVGNLFYNKSNNTYGFNYISDSAPVSLIMPYRKSTYSWKSRLHPTFDMNMPEGYLLEIFKNILSKEYGYMNDFLLFSYLAPSIKGRVSFISEFDTDTFGSIDLEDVLYNDTPDTFTMLLNRFLKKNSISGVQPKTIARLNRHSSLNIEEYIVKTWGEEFPKLAENEYFCLKAVEESGVPIPEIILSKNSRFLLVKRFNYDKNGAYLGFEEVLGLLGRDRDQKYSGSYEQVAKVIYRVSTDKQQDMIYLYKTIVMSYLLKNGDAHLKNFGILYSADFSSIRLSPTYDVVNSSVYMFNDKPALTMFGKKLWFGQKELVKFGVVSFYFSESESLTYYNQCIESLKATISRLESYISDNKEFKTIGLRMIDTFKVSLNRTTHKELPDDAIRSWT